MDPERFSLRIALGNEAFSTGGDFRLEVARILRKAAGDLEGVCDLPRKLFDFNGKSVGFMEVDED